MKNIQKENIKSEANKNNTYHQLTELIEIIIIRLTDNSEELNEMQFNELLRTAQNLSKAIQQFIKIMELSKDSTETIEYIEFIRQITENKEALKLANQLLEKIS